MKQKTTHSNSSYHLAFVALKVLKDNDSKMLLSDLLNEVYKRESKNITPAMEGSYSNGAVIWKDRLQTGSDIFVKAGFLKKQKGTWYLTVDGEKVLSKKRDDVIEQAKKAYRDWQNNRKSQNLPIHDEIDEDKSQAGDNLGQYESNAKSEIQGYIKSMLPYQFQDLCAALLRSMKYHVRDVAPPGPDGGIDVLAYTDPLGSRVPRIKVQVKHQAKTKPGKPAINQLAGLLTDGDIGVFISSSGFASGCRDCARNSGKHLELIDMERFIDLWQKHYDNLSEEDKSLLPMQSIYFLDKKRVGNE